MSSNRQITGKVSHHDLGTGFWGITDTEGNKWLPLNMPDQLKIEGATVECTIKVEPDVVTSHMWGVAVTIVAFETPGA